MKDASLINSWTRQNAVDKTTLNAKLPSYPNEFMVKLFASSYYSNLAAGFLKPGQKVLDVGCGAANNLRFFVDRGLSGYGVDVTDEFVDMARENVRNMGFPAEINKGFNDKIPYEDNFFDILISINTIHYQDGKDAYLAALREFKRVVKPGGIVLICTVGAKHEFRLNSERVEEFRWLVRDYGFRSNHHLGFCDGEEHLKSTLGQFFPQIEIGNCTERYPTRTIDFVFAMCKNAEA